jgi:hypothetical protein
MNQRNQNDIELSEDLMYRIQNYKELDEKNYNILELAENIINVRSNELSIFKNILYN